jgi:hypothetical protein
MVSVTAAGEHLRHEAAQAGGLHGVREAAGLAPSSASLRCMHADYIRSSLPSMMMAVGGRGAGIGDRTLAWDLGEPACDC